MAATRGLGKAGASILRSVLEWFNKALRPGLKQIGPAPPRAAITTGAKKSVKGKELMKPGPYASESIPARGSKRDFTAEERRQIDRIGTRSGCHSCGTKTPGTKSGHLVIDHQPPNALASPTEPQRLFPQCRTCSARQGAEIMKTMRRAKASQRKGSSR